MRRPILSSLVLLLFGIVFLLTNFGYLSSELWSNTFKYWPIILLFIGLEIIFTKKGSPNLLIVTIILVFALPFLLQGRALPFNLNLNFLNSGVSGTGEIDIEKKLGTLIGAKLNLDLKQGNLKVNGLEKTSSLLVKGTLGFSRISKEPTINFDPKAGIAQLEIQAGSQNLPLNINASDWQLDLSPVVPLDITVTTNGGQITLDLSQLKVDNIDLELGKTQTEIDFSTSGNTRVMIKATEGVVTLNIPQERAASVQLTEGVNADISTRFTKTDHGYQTEKFETAKDRIEISVEPGNAQVVIN